MPGIPSAKRSRSCVVVAPRSFLDAGTEVLPGERKFLDYRIASVAHSHRRGYQHGGTRWMAQIATARSLFPRQRSLVRFYAGALRYIAPL